LRRDDCGGTLGSTDIRSLEVELREAPDSGESALVSGKPHRRRTASANFQVVGM
jgi:hypothetical protein